MRYRDDGQVLVISVAQSVGNRVRYAVYPPTTPAGL